MTKYPKISTLFKRNESFKVIPELNVTDFENVKNIIVTEKIDGTNAQIELWHHKLVGVGIDIYSRNNHLNYLKGNPNTVETTASDKPDIMYIRETLQNKVNFAELQNWYFHNFCIDKKGEEKETSTIVRLFGEVYGKGINKGGVYSNERNFRVFDIQIGEHFISFCKIKEICRELNLKIVPIIYEGNISGWLNYTYLKSILSDKYPNDKNQTQIKEGGTGGFLEGFVIKSEPLLLNEWGDRICGKIKRTDFLK